MDSHPNWRLRARAALEVYFQKRSSPRLVLSLIVIVAGIAGLGCSYALLHRGFDSMAMRYPIAVIAGYIAFLIQLRLWVEIERTRYNPQELEIKPEPPITPAPPSVLDRAQRGDTSWIDFLDAPSLLDFDEGCAIGCLIMAVVAIIGGIASIVMSVVWAAPELLAEVFLDAFVVSMFYRHLKNAAREHWLGTAVKRTLGKTLLLAAVLSIVGYCLQEAAPESRTLGGALKAIF